MTGGLGVGAVVTVPDDPRLWEARGYEDDDTGRWVHLREACPSAGLPQPDGTVWWSWAGVEERHAMSITLLVLVAAVSPWPVGVA